MGQGLSNNLRTEDSQQYTTEHVDEVDDHLYEPLFSEGELAESKNGPPNSNNTSTESSEEANIYLDFNPCPKFQKEAYRCLDRIELYRLDNNIPKGAQIYEDLRQQCSIHFAEYRDMQEDSGALPQLKFKKRRAGKGKANRSKQRSILSFDEDGSDEDGKGGEAFVLNKSKSVAKDVVMSGSSAVEFKKKKSKSRMKSKGSSIGLGTKISGDPDKSESSGCPSTNTAAFSSSFYSSSAGMYTDDMLEKLKSNAIHIKGTVKKHDPPLHSEASTEDLHAMEVEQEEQQEEQEQQEEEGYGGTHHSTSTSSSSIRMFDAEQVAAARRKRERLRERGLEAGEEYVSLNKDKKTKPDNIIRIQDRSFALDTSDTSGTVVREDESDMIEDTFDDHKGSRISFHDPGRNSGSSKPSRSDIEVDLMDMDTEEVEEIKQWEEQQASKGASHVKALLAESSGALHSNAHDKAVARTVRMLQSAHDPLKGIGIDKMVKTLRLALSEAEDNQVSSQKQLNQTKMELHQLEDKLEKIASDISLLSDEYVFYQSVKDHVMDVLGCLNEKIVSIEAWTKQMSALHRDQMIDHEEKQLQHQEEEMALFITGTGQDVVMDGQGQVEVDEFGRNINLARNQAKERRKVMREKWRQNRISSGFKYSKDRNCMEEEEGWVSDWIFEESDASTTSSSSSSSSTNRKIDSLREEITHIFDDTLFEFTNFDESQKLFQLWKSKYPDTYRDAYISLSVGSLFSPYIQLELLHWNPFESPKLETMSWYQKLLGYGISESMAPDDDDQTLIPRLVSKLCVPVLIDHMKNMWRPWSLAQSVSMSVATKDILDHMEGMDALQNSGESLKSAILERIQQVSKAEGTLIETGYAAKTHFSGEETKVLTRHWWRCVKLLHCMRCFVQLLEPEFLWKLVSDHLRDHIVPLLNLIHNGHVDITDSASVLWMIRQVLEGCDVAWATYAVRSFVQASGGFFQLLSVVEKLFKQHALSDSQDSARIQSILDHLSAA